MKKEDLLRYIQNKGDEDFQQQVVDWITSSPENENFYHKVKAMYVAEFNVQEKLNTEEAFNKFKFQIKKQRFPYARIAAILILAVLVTGLYFTFSPGSQKIPSDYATVLSQQKTVLLADGTNVILNAQSKLSVDSDFNLDSRIVYLEGEAFFDVTENPEKPFIEKTVRGLVVRVLVTTFIVKSYAKDESVETTLVTGKVQLFTGNESTPVAELSPEQKVTFNKKSRSVEVENVKPEIITSWSQGVLMFEKTSIITALHSIERWYDVRFEIIDDKVASYSFSGKIKKDSNINEVLSIIEASSPIKYEYHEDKKIIRLFQK